MLVPELCPLLDSIPPLWVFFVIAVLILIIVIPYQQRIKRVFISKRPILFSPLMSTSICHIEVFLKLRLEVYFYLVLFFLRVFFLYR